MPTIINSVLWMIFFSILWSDMHLTSYITGSTFLGPSFSTLKFGTCGREENRRENN